jgi:hypothetical protein
VCALRCMRCVVCVALRCMLRPLAFLMGDVCGFDVALIFGCDLLRKCTCDANCAISTTCERASDRKWCVIAGGCACLRVCVGLELLF